MKTTILLALLLTGCARLNSTVTERGNEKITTVKVYTLFSAKSDLAKFATGQTEKSQKIAIGTLGQESTEPDVTKIVEAIFNAAVKAATP